MKHKSSLKFVRSRRPLILSRFTRQLGLVLIILIFCGYLFWQGWQLLGPPTIGIASPTSGYHTSQPSVWFKGYVDTSTSVSLNGSNIPLDTNGTFSVQVPLQPGANRLSIHLANHFGRTRDLTRIVTYDYGKN